MAITYAPPAKNVGGRPKSSKQVVSLRLDPEVLHAFKVTGPGWQAKINEVLKANLPRPGA